VIPAFELTQQDGRGAGEGHSAQLTHGNNGPLLRHSVCRLHRESANELAATREEMFGVRCN